MATPQQPCDRFRPATDFPQSIRDLDHAAANEVYVEMRECLKFTNRSRAQLLRRNEEHKQTLQQLHQDTKQLQALVNRLELDKQQISQKDQQYITELQDQLGTMSRHLDVFSQAFTAVESVENPMGFMAAPNRFYRFWQALKALVLWWREEEEADLAASASRLQLPGHSVMSDVGAGSPDDRRENPQMYTDPASQNRSLLDR
jgi:hypothetical protein